MIQILKYGHIIGFIIVIFTCRSNNNYPKNSPIVQKSNDTLVYTGCPEKIKVPLGSIIELRLHAIPVIGYVWLEKSSSTILKEHRTDEIKYMDKDNESSFELLHFEAIKKGDEELQLEYKRTFEKEIKNSCNILVEVY